LEVQRGLWRAARNLGRVRLCGKSLPVVWFVTDPQRTPDPVAIAQRLPRGTGVVVRHFGLAGAEATARRLAEVAEARGLILLIGADAPMAARVGAAGVHLPERDAAMAAALKAAHPDWIVTAAAHSRTAVRSAFAAGAGAVLLSAIFSSASPSAGAPIGVRALGRIARRARGPVYALGGVNGATARRLIGTGVAGFAAVEAFGN
jgi:thiamine-phosphate pyrophosphorylase